MIMMILNFNHNRRKFRSQTSDNMDRWKSRGGKSQRGEEKKREDQSGERVRRKKMQVREKVGKSRFTMFFPMIYGSGGSKSRLAKAAGAEPPGQMRDQKLHAVLPSATPATQSDGRCRQVPRLPRKVLQRPRRPPGPKRVTRTSPVP